MVMNILTEDSMQIMKQRCRYDVLLHVSHILVRMSLLDLAVSASHKIRPAQVA